MSLGKDTAGVEWKIGMYYCPTQWCYFPPLRGEYLLGNSNTASFHLLPTTPLGEEGDIIYLICEFDKLGVYSPLFLFPSCCESSSVFF